MKIYILLSLIIIFVGCGKQSQDNTIVVSHNFSAPETLLVELNTQNYLTDGDFYPEISDSLKWHQLDKEIAKQLLGIEHKASNEYSTRQGVPGYYSDADLWLGDHTHFYIYGKLDLQKNVESFVLLEFLRDNLFDISSLTLWLFNLKENKVCSVAKLAYDSDGYIDDPHFYDDTSIKNGIFTKTRIEDEWFLIENFGQEKWNSYKVRTIARYRVNEFGFIEFLKD